MPKQTMTLEFKPYPCAWCSNGSNGGLTFERTTTINLYNDGEVYDTFNKVEIKMFCSEDCRYAYLFLP